MCVVVWFRLRFGIRFIYFYVILYSRASWGFFSNITGEEAEKLLLEKGHHGSYLCRRSGTMAGAYTLSVRLVHTFPGSIFFAYYCSLACTALRKQSIGFTSTECYFWPTSAGEGGVPPSSQASDYVEELRAPSLGSEGLPKLER